MENRGMPHAVIIRRLGVVAGCIILIAFALAWGPGFLAEETAVVVITFIGSLIVLYVVTPLFVPISRVNRTLRRFITVVSWINAVGSMILLFFMLQVSLGFMDSAFNTDLGPFALTHVPGIMEYFVIIILILQPYALKGLNTCRTM